MSASRPLRDDPLAGFSVDRSRDAPPWRQIASHVHEAVVSGRLPYGLVLPAERAIARRLGVGRNTVRAGPLGAGRHWPPGAPRRAWHGRHLRCRHRGVGQTDGIPWHALPTAVPPASPEPESAEISDLRREAARLGCKRTRSTRCSATIAKIAPLIAPRREPGAWSCSAPPWAGSDRQLGFVDLEVREQRVDPSRDLRGLRRRS